VSEEMSREVPQIRFKVGRSQWAPEALGSIYGNIRNAFVGTASPYYTNDGYFYLQSNNVKNGAINRNTEVFINEAFYLKQQDNWLRTGDIVVVQSGHVGHTAVIPEELDNTAAHALIIISRPSKRTDSHFVNFQFQTQRTIQQVRNITTGNTIKHILASDMKIFELSFCDHDEQIEIGAYFKSLDRMIGLHQRKHDKLVTLKQAMLQKMFPQDGATTPEIRFKGFEGDWGKKPLKDIAKKVTEKNTTNEYSETFTNSAEFGIVSQRDYFDKDISNAANLDGYYVVEPDHFVYNPRISTFAPCGPVNRNSLGRTGVMSPLYTVFVIHGIDETFLEYFFKTRLWYPFMFFNGDTGARADRFSIKDSVFFEMPIPWPSTTEQEKIGSYFFSIDKLISEHTIQLEKLKNIKSACLEKMFV